MPTSSSHPTLCRNGCGFFGNPATDGMCSKCHRDDEARKTQQQTPTSTGSSTGPLCASLSDSMTSATTPRTRLGQGLTSELAATPLSDLPASSSPPTASSSPSPSPSAITSSTTPKKNRCHMCKKKIGLTGFHCRCGHQFCSLHRYADTHECTFDYKTSGREELEKHHPKIIAVKIEKL